jgi:hypothetical protein
MQLHNNASLTIPTDCKFLDDDDLVDMGVAGSVNTLRSWRSQGRGPKFIKVGKLVRYRLSDVEAFMDSLPTGGGTMAAR